MKGSAEDDPKPIRQEDTKPKVAQSEDSRDLTGQIKEVYTDAKGLDKAYQQGDGFENDNTLYIAGSHTARDWFDDVTKIPQWRYVPPGFSQVADLLNSPEGQYFFGTGDLRQSERYKKANEFLKNNPKTDTLVGHSLGGSVALQLQKDFPEKNFKTVTYGAPVWDPLGSDKAKIGQENVLRFSNKGDVVSGFDNSALQTTHPDPLNYKPSFWHDFHNDEQGGGRVSGASVSGGMKLSERWVDADKQSATIVAPKIDTATKGSWMTEPWAHINADNSISITE